MEMCISDNWWNKRQREREKERKKMKAFRQASEHVLNET